MAGDYGVYFENHRNLLVSPSDVPIIMEVEERTLRKRGSGYPKGLIPLDSADLILVTDNWKPNLKSLQVRRSIGGFKEGEYEPDTVFEILENLGVEEVRLLGEYVWEAVVWALTARAKTACLHTAGQYFSNAGFTTRMVDGCVFPDRPTFLKIGDVDEIRAMYENSIPLEEILS